ncbi:MAG: Gfo/Idh/MocA family oxidoreductase [Burkholderiales bacterium]|nr:Gfo/Idh/MocA family oxidoreductase [Burkholderiales bacterium]
MRQPDWEGALADRAADTAVVATRHDLHAPQVLAALRAGKHVFCEKPLCLTLSELEEIAAVSSRREAPLLMVGFNRRFAPHVRRIRHLLAETSEPKCFVMTVNAGAAPPEHWIQDREVGGGPHRRRSLSLCGSAALPCRRADRALAGCGGRS